MLIGVASSRWDTFLFHFPKTLYLIIRFRLFRIRMRSLFEEMRKQFR